MVSRRVVRSYQARYSMGANKASMYDLTDAIDVHAHARGQDEEEPMHAAQEATRPGMKAVLFKSISPGPPGEGGGRTRAHPRDRRRAAPCRGSPEAAGRARRARRSRS